jgi:hypothetical protein
MSGAAAWPISGPNVSEATLGAMRLDRPRTLAGPVTIRDRATSHDSTRNDRRALRRQRSQVRILPGASASIPPALKER